MKQYYISIPDNSDAFYAYVNLVINNKKNTHVPNDTNLRPSKIGWVKVSYIRNEVNEPFIVVENLKEKVFVEMIIDQFCLLRNYWHIIDNFVVSGNADRY